MSPDSPEQEADYTLTPRTEAKYNKIDEDFQLMMQRNQQQRVAISGANYTLPVTVPITANYGETGMLQASPQMAHTNISPRPSSSETDSGEWKTSAICCSFGRGEYFISFHFQISFQNSHTVVYQTNSMLDMSNGYPNSASPLGGSPSPGQSPNMGVHHNKCKSPKRIKPITIFFSFCICIFVFFDFENVKRIPLEKL